MEAFMCDICGSYYKKVCSNKVKTLSPRLGTHGTWIDYCPECVKAIQDVIDSRKDINKQNDNSKEK